MYMYVSYTNIYSIMYIVPACFINTSFSQLMGGPAQPPISSLYQVYICNLSISGMASHPVL